MINQPAQKSVGVVAHLNGVPHGAQSHDIDGEEPFALLHKVDPEQQSFLFFVTSLCSCSLL